jgi:hypothetical protein
MTLPALALARGGAVESSGAAAALRAGVFGVRRGRTGVTGRGGEGIVIATRWEMLYY